MGLGILKKVGGAVSGAVSTAKNVTESVADKTKDVGGAVLDKTKDVGGAVLDKTKDIGGDVVEFSKEVKKFEAEQTKNFAGGVWEWGKGTVGTVVDIAKDPVGTAKGIGELATNPVLNPVGGTIKGLIQGKNPVEAYSDGLGDLKNIGTGLVDGYKDVYKKHGVAGLLGNIAPDVVTAIATGGSATAAKTAGTVGAKAVAKDVAKVAAKDIGKELVPGAEDIATQARETQKKDQSQTSDIEPNFLQALLENFSF